MKTVALADVQDDLAALIREVEKSREEIVITRDGAPVVRLTPVASQAESRRAALLRLRTLRDRLEAQGRGMEPASWEDLKSEIRNENKDWLR